MDLFEIRRQVDLNNRQIEEIMKPNSFVLNSVIRDLLNENAKLRELCTHKFENGFCIYCDKENI